MAKIRCSDCGATLPSANVDVGTGLAKCECGNTFDFRDQVSTAPRGPQRVSPPEGMTAEVDGARAAEGAYRAEETQVGVLNITRRWMQPQAYFMLFFCIAWDSFLVFWYATALGGDLSASGGLVMVVFPLAHVAAGVGLTYYTLALFLNRTILRVSRDRVTVTHTPLPWKGARDQSMEGAQRINTRAVAGTQGRRGRAETWSVLMDTARLSSIPLIEGLPREDQALFIAAEIAAHQGIA